MYKMARGSSAGSDVATERVRFESVSDNLVYRLNTPRPKPRLDDFDDLEVMDLFDPVDEPVPRSVLRGVLPLRDQIS